MAQPSRKRQRQQILEQLMRGQIAESVVASKPAQPVAKISLEPEQPAENFTAGELKKIALTVAIILVVLGGLTAAQRKTPYIDRAAQWVGNYLEL